jgi:hypothetical protein
MAVAAVARLFISAVAPASYDLRDMILFVILQGNPIPYSPWINLEYQILLFWGHIAGSSPSSIAVGVWGQTGPPGMSASLQLLSLLLRFPSFLFDLSTAITLYLTIAKLTSVTNARLGALLWFLNPYTIFFVELLGVPDIATAFLTLCAVTCLVFKRPIFASLFLAAATALKLYPILLLPPILIYLNGRMHAGIKTGGIVTLGAILGLVGYVGWAFPGGVANLFMYEYTPVTQPLTLFVPYEPTFVRISAATVFLVLSYFALWYFANTDNITDYLLPVLLVYFTFSFLYPQYLIWLLPFLTLDVMLVKPRRVLLLTLLLAFVFVEWFMTSGGLPTPSGYSLLMFPLTGNSLPWFSRSLTTFLQSDLTKVIVFPVVESTLYAITFLYALEIIRGWFAQTPQSETL